MPGRRQDSGPIDDRPEVRAVFDWLALPDNRRLVRESAVWRVWPAVRESDPATALVVLALALRGPCERIPGRKLANPDRAEVVLVLAYLRNLVTPPGLDAVDVQWSWGDLRRLAGALTDAGRSPVLYWEVQEQDGVARSTLREAGRPFLVARPRNLDAWARAALDGVTA